MIGPNPTFQINVAEQRTRTLIRSTHRQLQKNTGFSESSSSTRYDDFFNSLLGLVRDALRDTAKIKEARLIDAHSFCWLLERLDEPPADAIGGAKRKGPDAGRILGPREKSLVEMRRSVLQTVAQSRGQIEEHVVKVKDLLMTEGELDDVLKELMEIQEDRCALSGLPFQFLGPQTDKNLLPSVDRIDSSGHYERGNLQLVCRFINFWKQDSDNEEFKRLLLIVRGIKE